MQAEIRVQAETTVVIIGAGIIGLMTALEIQRSGHHVIIIDPGEPGGKQAASYGNAAWISSSGIMPVSVPGLWRQVLRFLMEKSGPFVIRWVYLPRLLPWLFRFVWAGRTWGKVEECAKVRFQLCKGSPRAHQDIAAEAGVSDLIKQMGLLVLYESRSEFLADEFRWKLLKRFGVDFTELDDASLHTLEPNVSDRYTYGVRIDDGCHCTDVKAYCEAIAGLVQKRGGELIRAKATGFEVSRGQLKKVRIDTGLPLECRMAVVTAGIGSKKLAAAAGDHVSLESERGYHVVIADRGQIVSHPIMPADGKMAMTPTRQGLRVAGQVELASFEAAPDWRRAAILSRFVSRVFRVPLKRGTEVDRWMGHRPSTPDGLPCIGPARLCAGLFYGFGHGHTGLGQASATAKLLAALVTGQEPAIDPSPMSVDRF